MQCKIYREPDLFMHKKFHIRIKKDTHTQEEGNINKNPANPSLYILKNEFGNSRILQNIFTKAKLRMLRIRKNLITFPFKFIKRLRNVLKVSGFADNILETLGE